MSRATILGAVFATALILLLIALVIRYPAPGPSNGSGTATGAESAAEVDPSFIYGRVTTDEETTYEGRLRWGQDQEALWSDYFNGVKIDNPWLAQLPGADRPVEIFGIELGGERPHSRKQFMTRFGDITRVEAHIRQVHVTLKSGTRVTLDRFEAGDIDDGIRVWDGDRGMVDLDTRRIRIIEFLPAPSVTEAVPSARRLHGTVETWNGDFTGFIQWNRQDSFVSDELTARIGDTETNLRYDTIRSIAKRAQDSAVATLSDGREMALGESSEIGPESRGIYVEDPRYGGVAIGWGAFERVTFTPAGSGWAYEDFLPGWPITGTVVTTDGVQRKGRLVFDLDESETTDTLDAAAHGVNYNIHFDQIRSILPRGPDAKTTKWATVTLRSGEDLLLERSGDLADGNGGMLIFVRGRERPDHVAWGDIARMEFDHPPTR